MGPLKSMEPRKRTWFRRVIFGLLIGLIAVFLVGAALTKWFGGHNGSPTSTSTGGTQPPAVSTPNPPIVNPPTTTTTGSPPVTTTPPPKSTTPTTPDLSARQPKTKTAAIKAAEVALNNVTAGVFLVKKQADGKYHPSSQLVAMIEHLVAPNKQKFTLASAPSNAQGLARIWHWPSVEAASVGANYYVETKQYKVTSFKGGKATIWLYTKTGFTTLPALTQNPPDPGGSHYAPDLTVVHMVWVKGHWLFVDSQEPPGVEATFNRMARGLDYSVYEDALQPFMTGGFRNADDLP